MRFLRAFPIQNLDICTGIIACNALIPPPKACAGMVCPCSGLAYGPEGPSAGSIVKVRHLRPHPQERHQNHFGVRSIAHPMLVSWKVVHRCSTQGAPQAAIRICSVNFIVRPRFDLRKLLYSSEVQCCRYLAWCAWLELSFINYGNYEPTTNALWTLLSSRRVVACIVMGVQAQWGENPWGEKPGGGGTPTRAGD